MLQKRKFNIDSDLNESSQWEENYNVVSDLHFAVLFTGKNE